MPFRFLVGCGSLIVLALAVSLPLIVKLAFTNYERRPFSWTHFTNATSAMFRKNVMHRLLGHYIYPKKIYVASFAIVLAFAVVYWLSFSDGLSFLLLGRLESDVWCEETDDPGTIVRFLQCAYFSVVTFFSIDEPRYRAVNLMHFVAAAERILGATMFALFIVTLARQMVRR